MRKYLFIMLLSALWSSAHAQFNLFGAQYFQNQYLGNPAMAGLNEGLFINGGYAQQWSNVPGSPSVQFATLDNRSKKVGLGLNLYNDKAGLIKRSRIVGTYAYHLPLNLKGNELHFGLSAGALSERLATEDINGISTDISANRFNQRTAVLDGDFGAAYTSRNLTVQGAIPNLKNFFKKEQYTTANWNTFLTAVSYKFRTDSTLEAVTIEPKVTYRGSRASQNVFDIGVNVSLSSDMLQLMGIYHSTESFSMGFNLNYKMLTILSMYTSGTSAMQGFSNGNFEIGLGYHFIKK